MKKLLFTLIVTSIFCANAFCASPKADKIRITDAGGYYTSTEVEGALQEAGAAAGHNAVTLNTSADTFLNLTGQDLFLDDAPTNKLWGGPASGANTTPTYRAVVDDDIPDTITLTNITQIGTRTSVLLTDTADILYEEELNSLSELTAQITDVSTFLNNGTTFGGEVSGAYGSLVVGNDVLDDQYYDSEADLTTLLDNNYQPLEATLTDVADGTIAEDLVNTANPWADNEVADDITLTNITQITTRTSTLLTDTADLLYETELSNITELQAQIEDVSLILNNATSFGGDVSGTYDALVLGSDVANGTNIADNSIDSEHYVDGSIDIEHFGADTRRIGFVVINLENTTDFAFYKTPETITIANVSFVNTLGNVTGTLSECDSNGTSCVDVDADWTIGNTSNFTDSSFTNDEIDAGDWLRWNTTSTEENTTILTGTIRF